MIIVTYNRDKHRLTVKGHSGSGKPIGDDIICAGVSALVNTFAATALSFDDRSTVKLDAGDARITCRANSRYKATYTIVFDCICNGFSLLENTYPENVKFFVLG